MTYFIYREKRGERTQDSSSWTGASLEEVKEAARTIYDTGSVDRVEVRNERGELVFQWPRTVSKAP